MDSPNFLDPPTRESFAAFCRLLYERHLAVGIGGNVSAKNGDVLLVTPSGVSMRDITPASLVTAEFGGKIISGSAPSREFEMHRLIFQERSDINVVCHVHGSYIVAASTILEPGPNSLPPLTPGFASLAYPMPLQPFHIPGSKALAEAVGQHFMDQRSRALLLKNHGLITVGHTIAEALNIAEEIDEAARIYILTAGKGSLIAENLIQEIS